MNPTNRAARGHCLIALAALAVATLSFASCGGTPKKPIVVRPNLPDVPASMQGLIGTEVQFRNVAPVLVSGYGIVVGLNNSGGQPLNEALATTMERELGLLGVGKNADSLKGTALEGKTPRQVLQDPNVAVVLVQAGISPGAPAGSTFDVAVLAMNATSLEGGKLWTTDLRLGPATAFGGVKTRRVAVARGPLYTNPFASDDPRAAGDVGTTARVLSGGEVADSLDIYLTLNNPSHARAAAMARAINGRFTAGAGDIGPIARALSDSNVQVRVPARMTRQAGEFLKLISNMQIDESAPEQYARRYVESIKNQPETAEKLSWALESLGPRAVPLVRELYDYPELGPRLAGLKAGARLNDARAAVPLRDLAKSGAGSVRTQAISLLAEVDSGASIDLTLRELLREDDMLVRVAAYEALATRAERAEFVRLWKLQQTSPELANQKMSPAQLEAVARFSLPSGSLQSVERRNVEGKFLFDRVPGGEPLLYVTLQGTPRVVLFGANESLDTSRVVSVWDDRLLIAGQPGGAKARVQYRKPDGRSYSPQETRATVTDLVLLLARKSTPEDPRPGFDLSYAQVVAVLSALEQSKAAMFAFATERDRLAGEVLAAANSRDMLERPETPEDADRVLIHRGGPTTTTNAGEQIGTTPTIVPIGDAPKK